MKPDTAVEVDTQCYTSSGHTAVDSAPLMSINQVVAPATPYEGIYSAVKKLFSEQQVNDDDNTPPTPATSAATAAATPTPATPAAAAAADCVTSVNDVTCVVDGVSSGLDATVGDRDGRVKTADVASLPSPVQPLLGDEQVLSRAQRMALFSINQTDGLAVKLESAR